MGLIGLCVMLNIIVNNPISNSRYWAGTVLIALLVSLVSFERAAAFRWLGATLVFAAIVVFPYSDAFRFADSSRTALQQRSGVRDELRLKGDYDAFQQIVNMRVYTEHEGLAYGRQLLGSVAFWVPRSVWPDKPQDSGVLIGEYQNYANTNLSFPLWAEGYLNLGIVGLVALLVLTGVASRRFDGAWVGDPRSLSLSTALVPFLAAYQVILLRGSLLQATGRVVVLVALAVAASAPVGSYALAKAHTTLTRVRQ